MDRKLLISPQFYYKNNLTLPQTVKGHEVSENPKLFFTI